MTVYDTAAGGDRRRMPIPVSAPAVPGRAFRRGPRVGPPATPLPPAFASRVSPAGARSSGAPVPEDDRSLEARVGRPVAAQMPPPPPPVRRDPKRNTIDWTPDLVDWMYRCRRVGIAVTVLARTLGCSTQTVFTQFHRDPRGVPGTIPAARPHARISPREFARWGRGQAEDMPADVLAREVGVRKGSGEVIGPLTRLTPRPRIGRALDCGGDD